MRAIEKFPVDEKKMKAALARCHVNYQEAGRRLGYSDSWFSNTCRKGFIIRSSAVALESMFGISPADYAPDIPKENPVETPAITVEQLYSMMDYFAKTLAKAIAKELAESIPNALVSVHKQTEEWRINESAEGARKALEERGL